MELPVFNDNHKSSGGWMTQLASEYDLYQEWVERRGHSGAKPSFGPDQTDDMPVGNVPALIDTWAAAPDSYLDSSRLGHINRLLSGTDLTNDLYRQGQPTLLSPQHDPAPASMLPRLLDLAFDWFRTEGFAELHPLEQATLVYLRLLDLSPFATANESTALAAAGFYTRRRGYPALILLNGTSEDESSRYRLALEAAFGMLTQPLVELFADALIRTMRTEREDRR
ncbi:MAG: Fic family protein [Acidobacteria bacterium]|nr:Fic family protein [Acidobacteriota bacterium]